VSDWVSDRIKLLGLSPDLEAELLRLHSELPEVSPDAGLFDQRADKPPPLRNFVVKLLADPATAWAGYRLAVETTGFAFTHSTSNRDRQHICSMFMVFTMEFVRNQITGLVDTQRMLSVLIGEFENFANSRKPKFLVQQRKRGGQRTPSQDEGLWALASAVIDLLVENGTPEKDAAKSVERLFDRRGFALPKSGVTSETSAADSLLNRRARLRAGRTGSEAQATYDLAKSIIRQKSPDEAMAALAHALDRYGLKVR
jgi:hypothetical protein